MNCSPPGVSAHGVSQARILEWAAISFSRIDIPKTKKKNKIEFPEIKMAMSNIRITLSGSKNKYYRRLVNL